MFEQLLSFVLKNLLGQFVEDSDALQEKIQVGVWSGLIILENLTLKNSILELVDVPISLNYGYIGRFELRIPWSNLGVDPVTVVVDKINVLIEPKYEWDEEASDRREQAIKQAKLAAAEIFANRRITQNNNSGGGFFDVAKNWLLQSLLHKVVDNFEVTVREVHIRYEDRISCPSNFCIGVSLESLHVQSRDKSFSFEENYSPSRQKLSVAKISKGEMNTKGSETFYKLIQVNHLSVYWNPLVVGGMDICTSPFIGRPKNEIQMFMSRTIATRIHQLVDIPQHHYLLCPTDINSFLDVSINPTTGTAKVSLQYQHVFYVY